MDKIEALERIKEIWNSKEISLGDKIIDIATCYYEVGLTLSTTAAYIKATPLELDSLLALSEFDDEIIAKISDVNPPKTTWIMLSNASEKEIIKALEVMTSSRTKEYTASEYIYQSMLEISGPTVEQRIQELTAQDIKHLRTKGEDFNCLNSWEIKFMKSLASQRVRDEKKEFSEKQVNSLIKTLNALVDKGVIKRDSIDGDQEICDKVLDILGK